MTNPDHGDFGAFLKKARVEKGLSQIEVARILGLSSSQSISDWERNHGSLVPANALRRLIALYGLNVDSVFEELCSYQERRMREKLAEKFFTRAEKLKRTKT